MKKLEPKIIALKNQIDSGKLKTNSAYILQYIMIATQKGRGADKISIESAFKSTMVQSTVTSQLSLLEDTGMIFKHGTRTKKDHSLRDYEYSLFWYEPNPLKQSLNKRQRHHEKYKTLIKRLHREFPKMMSKPLKIELNNSLNFQTDLFD